MQFVYEEPKMTGGAPLRPGVYKAEITDAIEKTSKAGNEMIEIDLLVTEPKAFAGNTLRDYIVDGPKTKWKINQVLAAIGFGAEEGEKGELEPKHLVNKEVVIRVVLETNPKSQNPDKLWPHVKSYMWGLPAEEVDFGPDDEPALLPKAADKTAQPAQLAAAVTNTETEIQHEDDDIPF